MDFSLTWLAFLASRVRNGIYATVRVSGMEFARNCTSCFFPLVGGWHHRLPLLDGNLIALSLLTPSEMEESVRFNCLSTLRQKNTQAPLWKILAFKRKREGKATSRVDNRHIGMKVRTLSMKDKLASNVAQKSVATSDRCMI